MNLIVISPESEDPREQPLLAAFFAAGLRSYHVRKPTWTRDQLAAWLRTLPAEFHPRLFLHSHHELAEEFKIGGVHFRSTDGGPSPLRRSRAVHDLATLRGSLDSYDRLLFSPVFPSISKPGHEPDSRIAPREIQAVIARPHRAEVVALGGVDRTRLATCRELGFDGVAVLGAIWQAADPRRAFHELQNALLADAA